MHTVIRSRHDVVVVGARVAGSATALLLARLGHDVAVVDQASSPSDTPVHALDRPQRRGPAAPLGATRRGPGQRRPGHPAGHLQRRRADGQPHHQTQGRGGPGGGAATVRTGQHPGHRRGTGRRPAAPGGHRDRRPAGRDGRVGWWSGHDHTGAPVELGARYVVGADGLRSQVARSVGAAVNEAGRAGGAASTPTTPAFPGAASSSSSPSGRSPACSQPTTEQACIWVCTASADAKAVRRRTGSRVEAFDQLLEHSAPPLAERLRQARRTSPVQGMLRQPNQLRQAFGPGWALVGDAGYYRDAITAYGISDAFRDAELLPSPLTRRWVLRRRRRRSPPTSSSATRRSGRSSRSPAVWRPIRQCRPSSSCKSSSAPRSTGRRRCWPPGRSQAGACSQPPDRPCRQEGGHRLDPST